MATADDETTLEELEGSNVRPDDPDYQPGGAPGADEDAAAEPPDRAAGPTKLSRKGASFIARFEGTVLTLYNDPAGHCTIGIGHLVHLGRCDGSEPAEFRTGITRRRALELLQGDAADVARAIRRHVTVPLNQPQFDALCSFGFNCGTGAIATSTLTRRLNAGEYAAVPHELGRWVKAGGQTLPGLVRRRKAEGRLFARGQYE